AAASGRDREEYKNQLYRVKRRTFGHGPAGRHANFPVHYRAWWRAPTSARLADTAERWAKSYGYSAKRNEGFRNFIREIVKPSARGLAKNGEEVFMELRPRASLMPGEYAIIGEDLTRVVSFRIVGPN